MEFAYKLTIIPIIVVLAKFWLWISDTCWEWFLCSLCIIYSVMFSSFKKDKWTNFKLLWAFRQGWTDDFYVPWKGRGYRQLGTNNIAVFVGSSLHLFSSAWKYSFLNLLLQNSLLRTGIVGLAGGLDVLHILDRRGSSS